MKKEYIYHSIFSDEIMTYLKLKKNQKRQINKAQYCLYTLDMFLESVQLSEKELTDAKNNLIGKYAFLQETNIQQACSFAKYNALGFDFEHIETVKERIKKVTPEQILACAQKYFTDKYVLSIIKPE